MTVAGELAATILYCSLGCVSGLATSCVFSFFSRKDRFINLCVTFKLDKLISNAYFDFW